MCYIRSCLIGCCCVLFAITCMGQVATAPLYVNMITVSPLKVIDLANPGFEFGYQRNTGAHFATEVQATWQTQWQIQGLPYKNYNGARLGIGEKIYFPGKKQPHEDYVELQAVGLDVNYAVQTDVSEVQRTFYYDPRQITYADSFNVHKLTLSLNFKVGETLIIGKHWLLDWAIGFGVKFKSVTHSGEQYPGYYIASSPIGLTSLSSTAGNKTTINLPATLRFCYGF